MRPMLAIRVPSASATKLTVTGLQANGPRCDIDLRAPVFVDDHGCAGLSTPKSRKRNLAALWNTTACGTVATRRQDHDVDEQEVAAIPLVREHVFVTKSEVETGRFRIQVSVEEQ